MISYFTLGGVGGFGKEVVLVVELQRKFLI